MSMENPIKKLFLGENDKRANESAKHAFEDKRKVLIPQVGEQLKKETRATVEIGGKKLGIDYRVIAIDQLENKEGDMVVLLPGFGSGWEGISELGFSLACEGRRVAMPSLPGYGSSDNPSPEYYQTEDFDGEVEVIKQLLDQIAAPGSKAHLIGHSMGSEITAAFAVKYPEKVSSLVLLNPAGVEEKENPYLLTSKFVSSGAYTNMEFSVREYLSGEKDYEKELQKYVGKQKSPFSKERFGQRMAELAKVSKGKLLGKIKATTCPITYISGELESLYPPGEKDDPTSQLARIVQAVGSETRIETSVMAGLRHNTTIAPDEITAANIEHYLQVAEKKQKIGKTESL